MTTIPSLEKTWMDLCHEKSKATPASTASSSASESTHVWTGHAEEESWCDADTNCHDPCISTRGRSRSDRPENTVRTVTCHTQKEGTPRGRILLNCAPLSPSTPKTWRAYSLRSRVRLVMRKVGWTRRRLIASLNCSQRWVNHLVVYRLSEEGLSNARA